VKNSQATRAAERFFKERRATIHVVDLKVKPMAAGEIKRFIERFGLMHCLIPRARLMLARGLRI
jgi:arsenate reductase-like glutaredoxin family protein